MIQSLSCRRFNNVYPPASYLSAILLVLNREISFSITASVSRDNRQTRKDIERRRIDRALAALEEAVSRCREQDVRYGLGISAALSYLALQADERWPFEQFQKALADAGIDGPKPEARWQMAKASLNGIK